MGVYLSEPMTEKTIKEGVGKGFSYCMAEMQGKHWLTQDGARTWKTPPFTKLNSETVTPSSPYSTATEVDHPTFRPLGQQVRGKQIHRATHHARPLQIGQLRTGTSRSLQIDGRTDSQRARRQGTQRKEGNYPI